MKYSNNVYQITVEFYPLPSPLMEKATKEEMKKTKKQLLEDYDQLNRELNDIEWEMDSIAIELNDRFDVDVYDV